jgi:predicted flap endonuclease-1-like 5' DNA nuclease
MAYPLSALAGLDEETVTALRAARVRTTATLLERAKDAKGRRKLATETGIDEKLLLCLANTADRLRIKGMGKEYAELLQEAGVNTVRELGYRNPGRLAKAMAEANKKHKLVRLLPSDNLVCRWIETARKLPTKITY